MILFITSIDQLDEFRNFSCWFDTIDVAFDFINKIVSKGSKVVEAEIIDNNQRIRLPLEAFDGESFSTAIQALESEWQQILSEPPYLALSHYEEMLQWLRQQIKLYENQVTNFEKMIDFFNRLLQHFQTSHLLGVRRDRLIHRYESNIHNNQLRLVDAQSQLIAMKIRLNQLVVRLYPASDKPFSDRA